MRSTKLSTTYQLIILILIAVGLNANTLFNKYAVDDAVVFTENKLVEKGIRGIPEIVSHDFFYGLEGTDSNGLSGGRYRPFALIIFALEQQFFGENPFVSHLINVLLFALLIGLLFKLLQAYIFREQHEYLAFVTCLLFVVHPIHTEVIANVKSRDELIAFILLLVSSITLIKYAEKHSTVLLISGLFCFFIALLTRESAVAFIVVLPLIIYYFFNQSLKRVTLLSLPLIAVFTGYLFLRFSVVGFKTYTETDVLNAPFLYATASQAFATKVFILVKYIGLLFFPYPLSSDYSYNQIPYIGIFSFQFIISLLFLLSLVAYAFYGFKYKSLFSFCILYFMATIALVTNFAVNIGAPLAERLLFQPSLAFCFAMAACYIIVQKRSVVAANTVLIVILLLFSAKTVLRNAEWKNNETLYFADIIAAPNSARINLSVGERYLLKAIKFESDKKLKTEYLSKVIYHYERAIKIYPTNPAAYLDLGVAYFGMRDYFKAADLWIQAYRLDPANARAKKSTEQLSAVLLQEGFNYYLKGNTDEAIRCYLKATELNFNNVEAWYNLGGNYFLLNDTKNAIAAWENVLKLAPNHPLNKDPFYLH